MDARTHYANNILALPAITTPGSKYRYTNGGYIIVAHIFEVLTDKSWETLMQEKDLLAIRNEHMWLWSLMGDKRSNGTAYPTFADNPNAYAPVGGVDRSLGDWSKFLSMHLAGFKGQPGLVSTDSFEKLHTVAVQDGSNYTYGGWTRFHRNWAGGDVLTHNGSNTMNYAQAWIAPMKDAVLMSEANIGGDEAIKETDRAIEMLKKAVQ